MPLTGPPPSSLNVITSISERHVQIAATSLIPADSPDYPQIAQSVTRQTGTTGLSRSCGLQEPGPTRAVTRTPGTTLRVVWMPSPLRLFRHTDLRLLSTGVMAAGLESLHFVNTYLQELPIDANPSTAARQVSGACYVRSSPTPVVSPHLLLASPSALNLLRLTPDDVTGTDAALYLSGNRKLPGAAPVAHAYCGHQYGLFAGQLGDGAALTLGTMRAGDGSLLEVQLKGTGPTAFSRAGLDGRKVLRSSLRELLCSEAMHHLGVPTTRAATCVVTETLVSRDIHHTGVVTSERAAVVCRLAPTFLRIGSLEVCLGQSPDTGLSGPSAGDEKLLKSVLDYTISNFYPHITGATAESRFVEFFEDLVQSSAHLVAKWQSLAFCHGVLNTDNLSLVGLTMDYGPFAFMEIYNPDFVCNASDYWSRYSYGNQPSAVQFGFTKLAEVLEMVAPPGVLGEKLGRFRELYETQYLRLIRQKLGLTTGVDGDAALVADLFTTMRHTGADFTLTFRTLSDHTSLETALEHLLANCLCSAEMLKEIYRVVPKTKPGKLQRSLTVLQAQGHLLEQYLESSHQASEQLNRRPLISRVQSLTSELKLENDRQMWAAWMNKYEERRALEKNVNPEERKALMCKVNPRFVLRNSLLQQAVEAADTGDDSVCRVLLTMTTAPYHPDPTHLFEAGTKDHQVAVQLLTSHDVIDDRKRPMHIT